MAPALVRLLSPAGCRWGLPLLGVVLAGLSACVTVEGADTAQTPYLQALEGQRADLRQARRALGERRFAEAEAAARQVIASVPGADRLLAPAVQLPAASRTASMAWVFVAAALSGQDKDADAEQALGAALRADLGNAIARFNLGNLYARQRRHAEAATQYREVVRLDPRHRQAWLNLAIAESHRGRSTQAEGIVRRLLERDPGLAEAHNLQGVLYLDQGMAIEAVASFKRAVGLKPLRADHHFNLAMALELSDRRDDAIQAYRRFLELASLDDPGRTAVQQALRRLGAAEAGR